METIIRTPEQEKELFDRTIEVLVRAYLDSALKSGDCTACAVGNIIIANGHDLRKLKNSLDTHWLRYIEMLHRGAYCSADELDYELAIEQINSTGYTSYELHLIERAFERGDNLMLYYKETSDENVSRLLCVVDTLSEILHQDLTVTSSAKKLFCKTLK